MIHYTGTLSNDNSEEIICKKMIEEIKRESFENDKNVD